ncbi:unnamed protein product, partial [Rotaria sordida]
MEVIHTLDLKKMNTRCYTYHKSSLIICLNFSGLHKAKKR